MSAEVSVQGPLRSIFNFVIEVWDYQRALGQVKRETNVEDTLVSLTNIPFEGEGIMADVYTYAFRQNHKVNRHTAQFV